MFKLKMFNKKVKDMTKTVVAVSGGFDPVHVGHLRMFKKAAELGDELVVIINNDNWINAKKGYNFMSEKDRKEIIEGFSCVSRVMLSFHDEHPRDMSVCAELEILKPDIFANGGDRKTGNTPEKQTCKDLDIKMVFNVGGKKLRSSSTIVERYQKNS